MTGLENRCLVCKSDIPEDSTIKVFGYYASNGVKQERVCDKCFFERYGR